MPLSEDEQRVLERLEHDLARDPKVRAESSSFVRARPGQIVAAAVALPVGLALIVLALIMNSAGGVALGLAAYALIVASVSVVCTTTAAALATGRQGQLAPVVRFRRHLQ